MATSQIKEELYHFIETGDQRLINMLYAIAKEYSKEDFTLPGEPMDVETLEHRVHSARARIKSGDFTDLEDLENEMKDW